MLSIKYNNITFLALLAVCVLNFNHRLSASFYEITQENIKINAIKTDDKIQVTIKWLGLNEKIYQIEKTELAIFPTWEIISDISGSNTFFGNGEDIIFRDLLSSDKKSVFYRVISYNNKPNIIIIFADDLGYGDLGVYGQQKIKTPRLDQMASEGARFTDFYSASSWCPPARSSLLTGQHTGHTYLRHSGNISETIPLLPKALKDAGYVNGMFGKWGLATRYGDGTPALSLPHNMGFDEFAGFLIHRDAHVYYLDSPASSDLGTPEHPYYSDIIQSLYKISYNEAIQSNETVAYKIPKDRYTHDEFVDQTLAFIDRYHDSPFFLYLPFTIPHAELVVPPDKEGENLLGQYLNEDGTSKFPEITWNGNDIYKRRQTKPRATYAAMISRLDRDVGRILDKLREFKIDRNTLVFFTSDNGPHKEGGIIDPTFFNSAGGLSYGKRYLYEGGIRVPCIAWWPSHIPAGQVLYQPATTYDLWPTISEISGADFPVNRDGVSLLTLLKSQTDQSKKVHDYLYWEVFLQSVTTRQAVRKDNWKAVRIGKDSAVDEVKLFDLSTDAKEQNNVASVSKNYMILQRMKKIMNEAHTPIEYIPSGVSSTINFDIIPLFIDTSQDSFPEISQISNQIINQGDTLGPLQFTVSDNDGTPLDWLEVIATSSDQTLVPNHNIVLGGSGSNRTITITPETGQYGGPIIITMILYDGFSIVGRQFNLTVLPNSLLSLSATY